TVDDLLRFATELLNLFTPYDTSGRKRSKQDFSDEEPALNTYPARGEGDKHRPVLSNEGRHSSSDEPTLTFLFRQKERNPNRVEGFF
ncbi:hypothetical protein, partial [Rhodocaloribacter sp.]